MPNRIESEQNAKTKSYKNIVNYMTNEAKELKTTAALPASDDESDVKMQCKHASAKDQRNIQERTIFQKGCKTHNKRSKTAPKPLQIRPGTRPNPWTPKAKREPNSRGAFGKKHPKELPDVRKVVPQRRPGPHFWIPGGSCTFHLGFFGSHVTS